MDKEIWNAVINKSYDVEFDWFGIDKVGKIAFFSSFNRGFIPSQVTSSFEKFIEFKKTVDSLQKITTAEICTKNNGDFSDWISYSEKGLFSFDYQDAHRKIKTHAYDLISKPKNPLNILNIENFNYFKEILPKFLLNFEDLENEISFKTLENKLRNLT
ncbi:MAG: hypothetical protein EOP00_21960 [Pedobacter sp.]|nr:MAG: hypothetical protein EOP00_21960 [Pedobacter sp.]